MEPIITFIGAALAVAGAISTLGAAGSWLIQIVQAIKAPNTKQDKEIADLKAWREDVDEKLRNDNRRLNEIQAGDRVSQKALLALLAHGIDGNHQKQMEEAKEELQHHLINK